jgi:hypothetical protein
MANPKMLWNQLAGKTRSLKRTFDRFIEKWQSHIQLGVLLLLGGFLAAFPWDQFPLSTQHPKISDFFVHLFAAIGEAMAIAAVIAGVVDEAAKRKLLKEFAENISDHIVGRLLPEKLREQIHEYLSVDFVRHGWVLTFDLKLWNREVENGPAGKMTKRFVQLITTSEFAMENRSPFERPYCVAYEVMQHWFKDLQSPEIRGVSINGDPRVPLTKCEDGFIKLDHESSPGLTVPMPGHSRSRDAHKLDIKLVSAEYLADNFYTSFDALHPVLETTVRVRYPVDRLEVVLYLSFADNSEAEVVTPDPGIHKQWKIKRPILPGQGFLLRWRPVA